MPVNRRNSPANRDPRDLYGRDGPRDREFDRSSRRPEGRPDDRPIDRSPDRASDRSTSRAADRIPDRAKGRGKDRYDDLSDRPGDPARGRSVDRDDPRDDRPTAGSFGGWAGFGGGKPPGGKPPGEKSKSPLNYALMAIVAGVFILGIGVGIGFSSSASVDPQNVASREFIDRAAPNPELCAQFGASAISLNARIFVTLSPFSVYVAQPEMQPGCVMRSNNWAVLQQKGVVTNDQVNECKNRMNTFAFTGNIESKPRVDCVYQNDKAGNLFLNQPGVVPAQESDRF